MTKNQIKNAWILCLGALLWWGLFQASQESGILTASVLDLAEIQQIQKAQRDIAYKHENQLFELFGSESLQDASWLDIQVVYNPEKVDFNTEQLLDKGLEFELTTGVLSLRREKLWLIPLDRDFFQFVYSGDDEGILLAEAYALSINKAQKALKVWNLSAFNKQNSEN